METPLSPLDFARRTGRLHADREAVVDGELRLSYREFFDRCDRWSAALQGLGVRQGDRVATIAPNTHAQLEAFYAVPQIGAVLVPINYRLTAEDFIYIVNHSGAAVVCVHSDYLKAVDSVRDQMPGVRHFVAFEGAAAGWLDYEAAIAAADAGFERPEIGERDLVSINYTSGTTARPKGVMITHRNAAMNTIGTLLRDEHVSWLCAAPTVLISLANAPAAERGEVSAGVRVVTAGAPPAAATIERLRGGVGWGLTPRDGGPQTPP